MRNTSRHHNAVCLALILWLFANWSGMHAHYCFDGQEPLISTHVDVLNGHPLHTAEADHEDVDDEGITPAFFKLFQINPLLLCTAILLVLLPALRQRQGNPAKTPNTWRAPTQLRPPLRAPPCFPA